MSICPPDTRKHIGTKYLKMTFFFLSQRFTSNTTQRLEYISSLEAVPQKGIIARIAKQAKVVLLDMILDILYM